MKDLIKVTDTTINNETVQAVSARELHEALGVKDKFADWSKRYISKFVENQDYIAYSVTPENGGRRIEMAFSLDMAKHVAMMSETVKSYEVRQYFIECEKKLNQPQSAEEIILMQAQQLVAHKKQLEEHADRIHKIEAKQTAFEEGYSYFTILGYCAYKGINVDLTAAKSLGKRASALSREKQQLIDRTKDTRFGMVNSYHEAILDELVSEDL